MKLFLLALVIAIVSACVTTGGNTQRHREPREPFGRADRQ